MKLIVQQKNCLMKEVKRHSTSFSSSVAPSQRKRSTCAFKAPFKKSYQPCKKLSYFCY
jgi:hypothetical protein